jgi:hypothetical protein
MKSPFCFCRFYGKKLHLHKKASRRALSAPAVRLLLYHIFLQSGQKQNVPATVSCPNLQLQFPSILQRRTKLDYYSRQTAEKQADPIFPLQH